MSKYVIPDFSVPLDECEYNRLRKYCINAATFLLERYGYSRNGVYDFFVFKKKIPDTIRITFPVDSDGLAIDDSQELDADIFAGDDNNSDKSFNADKTKASDSPHVSIVGNVYSNARNVNNVDIESNNADKKLYTVDVLNSIFKELEQKDIINDYKYALQRAESLLLFKKKSAKSAANSLRQKGFNETLINQVIEEVTNSSDFDEHRALVSEADKIVKSSNFLKKDSFKRRRVFIQRLVTKGFSLTDIAELLDKSDYRDFFDADMIAAED